MKKQASRAMEVIKNNSLSLAVGVLSLIAVILLAPSSKQPSNNITDSSVMIVNAKRNSGGTGVIYSSAPGETKILTNSHVCGVVNNGGLVVHNGEAYLVSTTKRSELYDLCLVTIAANLGINTTVADRLPNKFETASVVGHPALLPTVVTTGHFSGNDIVQVLVGFEPCKKEDLEGQDAFTCALFGVKAIVKVYESQLVTATIMPGSSGSGVYNSDKQLTGLVFAGAGQFGYGWTVPYESLLNFLKDEAPSLNAKKLGAFNPFASLKTGEGENKSFEEVLKEVRKVCNTDKAEEINNICNLVKGNLVWTQ